MSSEEFWHGDPRLVGAYREAERIKRDNRYLAEWRTGVYVYEALVTASPAFREISKGIKHDYPEEPLFTARPPKEISQEEKDMALMERNKAVFLAMAEKFNAEFAEREGER